MTKRFLAVLMAVLMTATVFAVPAFADDDPTDEQIARIDEVLAEMTCEVDPDNIEVEVVMHGDGLGLLMAAKEDDGLQTRIGGLKGQNVQFRICANTLKGRDIALDDLYDAWDEDVVPSGVAQMSKLQQDGYTYIRP